jgi:hypothetical protein
MSFVSHLRLRFSSVCLVSDRLKDEDLAGRIGANTKDTAKRLGKLVNSRLVMW